MKHINKEIKCKLTGLDDRVEIHGHTLLNFAEQIDADIANGDYYTSKDMERLITLISHYIDTLHADINNLMRER